MFHATHISEGRVVDDVDSEVITHQINIIFLVFVYVINSSKEFLGFGSLEVSNPLTKLNFFRDFLPIKCLPVSLMESRNSRTSAIKEVVVDAGVASQLELVYVYQGILAKVNPFFNRGSLVA